MGRPIADAWVQNKCKDKRERNWNGKPTAKAIFDKIDKNGDGHVSKTELKNAMKAYVDVAEALNLKRLGDAAKFVESADMDQNARMEFEEFQSMWDKLHSGYASDVAPPVA